MDPKKLRLTRNIPKDIFLFYLELINNRVEKSSNTCYFSLYLMVHNLYLALIKNRCLSGTTRLELIVTNTKTNTRHVLFRLDTV